MVKNKGDYRGRVRRGIRACRALARHLHAKVDALRLARAQLDLWVRAARIRGVLARMMQVKADIAELLVYSLVTHE